MANVIYATVNSDIFAGEVKTAKKAIKEWKKMKVTPVKY